MANQDFVAVSSLKEDEQFNVKITTSDCVVTGIGLLAWKFPKVAGSPIYSLPIRVDGTTRCLLDAGRWTFNVVYRNDKPADPKVNIVVATANDPSTSPEELPALGGNPYEDRSYSFDVYALGAET